jgi:hypothetical protein
LIKNHVWRVGCICLVCRFCGGNIFSPRIVVVIVTGVDFILACCFAGYNNAVHLSRQPNERIDR